MIEIIFIVALIVTFINTTFQEGQIFEKIADKLKPLPEYIRKPLYECPICMSPYHGSLILFVGNLNGLWHVDNWFEWIVILFGAGGANTIFMYIVNQGKAISKVLNEYECNCTKKEDKDLERKERLADATVKLSGEAGEQHVSNTEYVPKNVLEAKENADYIVP